jgi:peptidoglycan hydrolase-like protein with peptidoglycan-binding domain
MNATVEAVQTFLNGTGYASPPLTVDGEDGPLTIAAVEAYQTAMGLVVDGKAGPLTLADMGLASAPTSTSSGSSGTWTEIPSASTPLTAVQAAKAFDAAYRTVAGKSASAAVLGLMLAQSALETGSWGPQIRCYNFGGAKAATGDKYIQYFTTTERDASGVTTTYEPPSPVCRFAAYKDPASGAAAYVRLLKSRPNWWAGLQSGTVDGFIGGLTSSPAYFTASPASYSAGLSRELSSLSATAAKYAGSASGIGLGSIIAIGLAGVGLWKLWKFGRA